jgi:phosphoserine phosphatase
VRDIPRMKEQMSGPQFVQSVLELKPKLAVFDCDGTLWSGDAGADFFYWEMKRGLIPREVVEWALPRYDAYKAGDVEEDVMCGEMVTINKGVPEETLRAAAEEFFREVVAMRIFPQMQELTMELGSSGCDLWAVSSTNNWVVEAGVQRFGIPRDHVLAACVEIENGCASDRLRDVPTDEGKAATIKKNLPGKSVDVAFGNSRHDVHMLELAKHPFAIAPDEVLERVARERVWRIYHPETR